MAQNHPSHDTHRTAYAAHTSLPHALALIEAARAHDVPGLNDAWRTELRDFPLRPMLVGLTAYTLHKLRAHRLAHAILAAT